MSMTNLIGKIASEIQRANEASGGSAATVHDAISALIASGSSGTEAVSGTLAVTNGSTKSITHNAGWRKYFLFAILEGENGATASEYRAVAALAYVDLDGVGVSPNPDHNTFFCAQRCNIVTGAYSTGSNTVNSSTENVCTCTANALTIGSFRWVCVKAG